MSPSASPVGLRSGQDRQEAPALQQDLGPERAPDPQPLARLLTSATGIQKLSALGSFRRRCWTGTKALPRLTAEAERCHLAQVRAQGTCAPVSLLIGHFYEILFVISVFSFGF